LPTPEKEEVAKMASELKRPGTSASETVVGWISGDRENSTFPEYPP
jgi:hypothetical protein